jgi:hypothetical protein
MPAGGLFTDVRFLSNELTAAQNSSRANKTNVVAKDVIMRG